MRVQLTEAYEKLVSPELSERIKSSDPQQSAAAREEAKYAWMEKLASGAWVADHLVDTITGLREKIHPGAWALHPHWPGRDPKMEPQHGVVFFPTATPTRALNDVVIETAPSTEERRPPGARPGAASPKDKMCAAMLLILEEDAKQYRGHGGLTRLAEAMVGDGRWPSYTRPNTIETYLRPTFKEWMLKHPPEAEPAE